jgi:predicted alpha/beta superfamily hydrolase
MLPVMAANAQYTVKIMVSDLSGLHRADTVFVAGNFNDWNPAGTINARHKEDGKLVFVLAGMPAGNYEFKFTRGSWSKVACANSGADLPNNTIRINSDTTVQYQVEAWKDDFPSAGKIHTASANVYTVDTSFYIPQLQRRRRISIYLPEGYQRSNKHYPVLYMHDGQNLFDEYLAGYGEWGVDECLDTLMKKTGRECIVVGIDNGPRRMNEYNPFYLEKFGAGEGDAYVNFLVQTLKPYIDGKFRTLTNKENTIIAGSSMGGLISYYAVLRHPDVFGKAGIFSPAFWTADSIKSMTDSLGGQIHGMFFFYMGGNEGDRYLADMNEICDKLGSISSSFIYKAVDGPGVHNEQAWRKWFGEFFSWITADGYNYSIRLPD